MYVETCVDNSGAPHHVCCPVSASACAMSVLECLVWSDLICVGRVRTANAKRYARTQCSMFVADGVGLEQIHFGCCREK